MDIKELCVQEIALEGLDGITMPTLTLRLNNLEPALPYKISDKLEEFLWHFILQYPPLQVLQIPEPRNEPEIFDRFQEDLGHQVPLATAPDELNTLVEVYSTRAVDDDTGSVRGSCSNYRTRVNIKDKILKQSLDLAASFKKYGKQQIIVVASQALREQQLLSGNLTTLVLADLSPVCYCVLEKVARSRWQGVIMSNLNKMDFPHKAFHAVVLKLHKVGLVSKMHHTYRLPEKHCQVRSQVLVTLKKFGREGMSFSSKLFKRFLSELQQAPNQTMNLGELKEKLNAAPKVFKTAYKSLKDSGEIEITGVIPGKHSRSVHQMNVSLVKTISSMTIVEEADDEDNKEISLAESDFMFGPLVLERPYLYQAYNVIVQNGGRGVSQSELQIFLKGFGKLESRYVMKVLHRMNLVDIILIDRGRQRIQMYTPKNVSNKCSTSKEFNTEKEKMQQLVLTTKNDSSSRLTDQSQVSTSLATVEADNSTTLVPQMEKDQSVMSKPDATNRKRWDASLTARSIKRHNIILEHVNREKVVTGCRTLQKVIRAVEKTDGYKTVIDLHSVERLVTMMNENQVLCLTEIPVSHGDVIANLNFVSSLDCPDTELQSAIKQAEYKLAFKEQNRVVKMNKKAAEKERREARKDDEACGTAVKPTAPSNKLSNRCFQPKFIRLRSLHQFFWYLAYGHPHTALGVGSSEIIDQKTQKLYDENLSWKRYLPPTTIHMINGRPWLQVGELVLLMPLSVFCQFHRVPVVTEELKSFLLDEDKCHTLVHHLPASIRCLLLDNRKYMLSLSACVDQLFFMGLITMRRSKSAHKPVMSKDQMMIYVHKNSTVVDTRTSGNGYMKVDDKEYERLHYVLDEFRDVESFWYQLQAVCMQTKLGWKEMSEEDSACDNSHLGDTTVKRFVKDSFKHLPEPIDDGTIPGDGLGAGGVDSSMFSYLYRNWNSPQTIKVNYHDSYNNELVPFQRSNLDTSEKMDAKRPRRSRKNNYDTDCNPPAPKRSKTVHVSVVSDATVATVSNTNKVEMHSRPMPTNQLQNATVDEVASITAFNTTITTVSDTNKDGMQSTNLQKAAIDHIISVEARDATVATPNDTKKDEIHGTEGPRKATVVHIPSSSSKQQCNSEVTPVIVTESNIGRNERVKGGRGLKRKPKDPLAQELQTFSSLGIPKRRRRRKPPPMGFIQQGKQRVKYVDKVDLEAIKSRKGRIRAVFSKEEDSLYLLCHVTTSLLIHLYWKKPFRPRKQIIPWSVVRDIAYQYLPESHDKTSYSVGRRTHVIMKNPETRICHDISVADIISDVGFLKKFCPAELNLETENTKVHELYRNLVDHLRKRFKTQPGLFCTELPNSNEQLLQQYTPQTILCKNEDIVSRRTHFEDDIHDSIDIKKSIAENMIYIALSMSDSEFSIYQAYRAFQEYTEAIVSDAFTRMRLSGFICRNKTAQRKVPCAMRRYRLAQAHARSLQSPVPRLLIDNVSRVLQTSTDIEVKTTSSVETIFLTSYFWTKKILDISVDIPKQVVLPETSNTSAFENQFRSMLQGAEEDLLMKLKELQGKDFEGGSSVPPDSLMAAVGTILKENFDDDTKRSDGNEAVSDTSDKKLKIVELIRLYYRHPSYTNWLILMKPTRRTESKFASLNFSSTSDCIVLTPCKITIRNVVDMSAEFCQTSSSKQIPKLKELLASKQVNVSDSETKWQLTQQEKIDTQSFVMIAIFNTIDKSSYGGIKKSELLQSVPFDRATAISALDKLLERNFAFCVGIKEQQIVSFRNVSPWTAKGFKFIDSTVNFQSEIQYEIQLFQNGKANQEKVNENSSDSMPAGERIRGRYEEVKFICRPWHNLYGDICYSSAKSLLTSVFMKVYSSPGITKEAICATFIYQPVCILELLAVLRDTDCIHEKTIDYPGVKRLFRASSPAKTVVYYEATDEGLIILSQWVTIANKLISMSSTLGSNA